MLTKRGVGDSIRTAKQLTEALAQIPQIGSDVLTVASNAQDVEKGIALGFDVISGRPKLVANLTQAHNQNVAFNAAVLKMMKVLD